MTANLPDGWEQEFDAVYGNKLKRIFAKNGVEPHFEAQDAEERLARHLKTIAMEFFQLGAFTHGQDRQKLRLARKTGGDPVAEHKLALAEGQVLGRSTMDESLEKLTPLLQEHEIPTEMRVAVQELHRQAAGDYFSRGVRTSARTLANKQRRQLP